MNNVENSHNANLLNTLPDSSPIVNYIVHVDGESVHYHIELAPKNLFVKITNAIFGYHLKPRLLEFYCLLSYLIYSYPDTKLSFEKIKELIYLYTHFSMSVNTINKYINILLKLKLIQINNRFYSIGYGQVQDLNSNQIHQTKGNYTNFFITIYNQNSKKGAMALEFYMASKIYKNHRPKLVTSELSISTRTYYTYLQDLLQKRMVKRTKISYKQFLYSNIYRVKLWDDYIQIKDGRYYYKKEEWKAKIKVKSPHSRLWFASPMARIMKEYKINYIQAFDNYEPEDAYAIVLELEQQYKFNRNQLEAPLIVKAIQNAYNWTKISDRKHQKSKRELRNQEIRLSYPENYVDYMMSC
jgi:hypothetical protein